jgi:hypothetical protein
MGWKFYDSKTSPEVFSIVWCKWPYRGAKLEPSDEARPVLVLDVREHIYDPTGEIFADLTVAYGTGAENISTPDTNRDLLIREHACRSVGLHKATIFQLDLGNRKRLPWGDKYFVPNEYVAQQNIVCGKLSENQRLVVLTCFNIRSLQFPLP